MTATGPQLADLAAMWNRAAKAAGEVMEEFSKIALRAVDAFVDLYRGLNPIMEPQRHIALYGPRNVDHEGTWQTDLCAAWVHDWCPSRHCACTCHGGSVR